MKAYATVCAQMPLLRTAYQRWPWPHWLESDTVVSMMIINRQDGARDRLCWGRFITPQETTLVELQAALHSYQTDPVTQAFRKQVLFSKLPWPIRRLLWWAQINFSGRKRPSRMGTFSQSTLAGQGANNGFHQTILTSSLCFSPLDAMGNCTGTLICDHRVIDGSPAAAALQALEETLTSEILKELQALAK